MHINSSPCPSRSRFFRPRSIAARAALIMGLALVAPLSAAEQAILDKGAEAVRFDENIEGFRQTTSKRTVTLRGFGAGVSAKRRREVQADVVTLTATRPIHNASDPVDLIRIGSFPGSRSGVYSIHGILTTRAPTVDRVRFRVTWYDAQGRSTSEMSADLGHVSGVSVEDVPIEPGRSQPLSLVIRAPELGETTRGVIEIAPLPAMRRGEALVFDYLRVQEAELAEGLGDAIPVEGKPSPSARYAENPVVNASFEKWEAGVPSGWTFEGEHAIRSIASSPFGDRAVVMTSQNEDEALLSRPFPVRDDRAVSFFGWARFDQRARYRLSHRSPVRVRFYDGQGKQVGEHRESLGEMTEMVPRFGNWLPIIGGPEMPPEGATHARAVVIYDDVHNVHYKDEPYVGGTGMLLVDNVMVYQPDAPLPASDIRTEALRFLRFARVAQHSTPPFFAVNAAPAASLMIRNYTNDHANLYEADARRITPEAAIFNLLPIEREIEYHIRVVDWNGETLESSSRKETLAPYELNLVEFPFENPGRFGPLKVELEAREAGRVLTTGRLNVVVLPEGMPTPEERASRNYPYWMLGPPARSLVAGQKTWDELNEEWLFTLRNARRIGVKGVRVSLTMHHLDFDEPEIGYRGAERTSDVLRDIVAPTLKREGMDWYLTVVDQKTTRRSGALRTDRDAKVFVNFLQKYLDGVPGEMSFVLYGNEGVTSRFPEVFNRYSGNGQTWMREYTLFRDVVKRRFPRMPVGPSQAADVEGAASETMLRMFPDMAFDCWGVNCYHHEFEMGRAIHDNVSHRAPSDFFIVYPEVSSFFNENVAADDPMKAEFDQALCFQYRWSNTFFTEPRVKALTYFAFAHFKGKFSLFHADLTPRMIVGAHAAFAALLGAGEITDTAGELAGEYLVHTFTRDAGEIVGLAFVPPNPPNKRDRFNQDQRRIAIQTGVAEVEVADMFGNRRPVRTREGVLELEIGMRPQFILGAQRIEVQD